MAEAITLADIAFGVGLLTTVFGFYWRFVRTGVEWQKDMEARMRMIEESVRRHEGPVKRHGIQVSKGTWVTVGASQEVTDAVRGDPCRGRTKTLHRGSTS